MGRNNKDLSQFEKGQIEAYKDMNLSNFDIAKKLNRDKSTVTKYLQKTNKKSLKQNSGRKSKLDDRQKRHIFKLATKDRMSCRQLKGTLDLPVSCRTVQRSLHANRNANYEKMMRTIQLKKVHIDARLQWARIHKSWTYEWKKVLFTDEKKFNLDGPDGMKYYWHDKRKKKETFPRRVAGGGGVMVWAGISFFWKTDLAIIPGRMDSKKYQNILDEHLMPFIQQLGHSNVIFQQDNAPVHVSQSTKAWLESKNIDYLEWPALSPDLNPIENLWGILVKEVYKDGRFFSTVLELKNAISESWTQIDQNLIKRLINTMEKRVNEVIDKNGQSINY
jgi:transposase